MSDSENWASFEEEKQASSKAEQLSQDKSKALQSEEERSLSPKPVNWFALKNRIIFGSLVGFATGASFGAIDSARSYHKKNGRMSMQATHSIAKGAATGASYFAAFFCGYQGLKTLLETQRQEDDFINVGVATVGAALPFYKSTVMRQNIPYALMLIAMDYFHEEISDFRNS